MSAVSTNTSEYELVLMLDPEVPDERRDGIAADALRRIEAAGSLRQDRAWGMRKLAYEIRQRTEADYRFFRFAAEPPLLEELDHNLKIADGVLRFRIFEVDPDSPVIEPPPPVALAGSAPGRGQRRGEGEQADRAGGEQAAAPAEANGASTPEPAAAEQPEAPTPAPAPGVETAPPAEAAEGGTPPVAEGDEAREGETPAPAEGGEGEAGTEPGGEPRP